MAQILHKERNTGTPVTTIANAHKPKSFARRLWDAFTEKRAFAKELQRVEDSAQKSAWAEKASKEAGKMHIAKLLLNTLIERSSDLDFSDKLVNSLIAIYPTLSQKERAKIFKMLVKNFCKATRDFKCDETLALQLSRVLIYIGNESKTTYKNDDGKLFAKPVEKLTDRLNTLIENSNSNYEDSPSSRIFAADIKYSFENQRDSKAALEFLKECLKDQQLFSFAIITLACRPDGMEFILNFISESKNNGEKNAAIRLLAMLSMETRQESQLASSNAKEILVKLIRGPDLPSRLFSINICIINDLRFSFGAILAVVKNKREPDELKSAIEGRFRISMLQGNHEAGHMLDEIYKTYREVYGKSVMKLKYAILRNPASSEKELSELEEYAESGIKAAIIALKEVRAAIATKTRSIKVPRYAMFFHLNGMHGSPYQPNGVAHGRHHAGTVVVRDKSNAGKLAVHKAAAKISKSNAKAAIHIKNKSNFKRLRAEMQQIKNGRDITRALRSQGVRGHIAFKMTPKSAQKHASHY